MEQDLFPRTEIKLLETTTRALQLRYGSKSFNLGTNRPEVVLEHGRIAHV